MLALFSSNGKHSLNVVLVLTPVARLIFETKNRAIFLERFFGRGISGAALLPYNFVPITWLWSGFIFPELEHL